MTREPTHIEYAGFLWCRDSKRTIGKYEGEVDCEHCNETIEVAS